MLKEPCARHHLRKEDCCLPDSSHCLGFDPYKRCHCQTRDTVSCVLWWLEILSPEEGLLLLARQQPLLEHVLIVAISPRP